MAIDIPCLSLRVLMDEKVDVYAENARFDRLLGEYYEDRTKEHLLQDMYKICFRCACNKLKRQCGSYKDSQYIIDKALEVCAIIFSRIKNVNKYPDGYKIKNLPTCVSYALLNVLIGSNNVIEKVYDPADKEVPEDTIDLEGVVSSLDERTFKNWELASFHQASWEDEIIDRIDRERI